MKRGNKKYHLIILVALIFLANFPPIDASAQTEARMCSPEEIRNIGTGTTQRQMMRVGPPSSSRIALKEAPSKPQCNITYEVSGARTGASFYYEGGEKVVTEKTTSYNLYPLISGGIEGDMILDGRTYKYRADVVAVTETFSSNRGRDGTANGKFHGVFVHFKEVVGTQPHRELEYNAFYLMRKETFFDKRHTMRPSNNDFYLVEFKKPTSFDDEYNDLIKTLNIKSDPAQTIQNILLAVERSFEVRLGIDYSQSQAEKDEAEDLSGKPMAGRTLTLPKFKNNKENILIIVWRAQDGGRTGSESEYILAGITEKISISGKNPLEENINFKMKLPQGEYYATSFLQIYSERGETKKREAGMWENKVGWAGVEQELTYLIEGKEVTRGLAGFKKDIINFTKIEAHANNKEVFIAQKAFSISDTAELGEEGAGQAQSPSNIVLGESYYILAGTQGDFEGADGMCDILWVVGMWGNKPPPLLNSLGINDTEAGNLNPLARLGICIYIWIMHPIFLWANGLIRDVAGIAFVRKDWEYV